MKNRLQDDCLCGRRFAQQVIIVAYVIKYLMWIIRKHRKPKINKLEWIDQDNAPNHRSGALKRATVYILFKNCIRLPQRGILWVES